MPLSSTSRPGIRGRVLVRVPATLQATGGLAVEKEDGVWTLSPDWTVLALEETIPDPENRQIWALDPNTETYYRITVQAFIDNLPAGPAGEAGPIAGILQAYDSTTADADPGPGEFRLNNATVASATAAYLDNLDADGGTVSTIIDKWDDSTSTTRGFLRIEKEGDSSIWAEFTVTGSVVDGTGYRKLTLTGGSSNGTFVAADQFRISFTAKGDKGTDGAGAGDVVGPASATDHAFPRYDLTTGKLLQDSGVIADDSNNVSGMATLTLPNTGLHLLDTNASHDLIIVPGSDLAADRTLTIVTGDSNRSFTLTADSSIGGTAYVAGGTDVAIADGGTNASSVGAAQHNLGTGLVLAGYAINVDFNAVADTTINLTLPTGEWRLFLLSVTNTGTTASLTTAQCGLFTASGGGGLVLITSGTALSALTSNTVNTAGTYAQFNAGAAINSRLNVTQVFFRITQAQGAAAAGNVYIYAIPLPTA
jgi:hypothetical protein